MSKSHYSFETLLDYVENQLDLAQHQKMRAHISTCDACLREVSSLSQLTITMSSEEWNQPPRHVHNSAVQAYRNRKRKRFIGMPHWLAQLLRNQMNLGSTIAGLVALAAIILVLGLQFWNDDEQRNQITTGATSSVTADANANENQFITFADGSTAVTNDNSVLTIEAETMSDLQRQIIVAQASGSVSYRIVRSPRNSADFVIKLKDGVVRAHSAEFTIDASQNPIAITVATGSIFVEDGPSAIQFDAPSTITLPLQ